MAFMELELDEEKHYIAENLIGHWSVTRHPCEKCGMERYVLDIYDIRGLLLCSFVGTKKKIEKMNSELLRLQKKNLANR